MKINIFSFSDAFLFFVVMFNLMTMIMFFKSPMTSKILGSFSLYFLICLFENINWGQKNEKA